MSCQRTLIQCAMLVDGETVSAQPGAMLLEGRTIIASGAPESIGPVTDATVVDRQGEVLLPGLVNAHAHLDLTHLGPIPYEGDFMSWIEFVRTNRAADAGGIANSVKRGIELALAGGTTLIGDIAGAGSTTPIDLLRESPLGGIGYLEVFGIGKATSRGLELIHDVALHAEPEGHGVRLGLQPHAPYSCAAEVYRAALDTGLPVSTHLAETLEEVQFVDSGDGPFADMLKRFGIWDEGIQGSGRHPVEQIMEMLDGTPLLAAHLNYLDDRHLDLLNQAHFTAAYCPRASEYFGHPAHRYRDLIDREINVALGTDSLLCLDTADRIGVLDEMRHLHRRDGTDPRLLLRMGTTAGARALGFDPSFVTLAPGPSAGIIALPIDADDGKDPLQQVFDRSVAPRWVLEPDWI